MTRSGSPGVPRVRRDERDRGGGAREVPGVRPDRRQRRRGAPGPRPTMNAQRCWFLELWARRPGAHDPVEVGRLERPAVELADRALRPDRVPGARHGAAASRRRTSRASDRKPPGSSSSVTSALGVGEALGGDGLGDAGRLVRRRAGRRGTSRGSGRSPRGTRGTRTATSAGRRRRRASRSRRPGGRRGGWRRAGPGRPTGTTPSSVPWTSSTGTRIARTARLAETDATCGRGAAGRRGS